MNVLDTKLLRDLWRLWAQSLAIALVMGGGVATVVLALGSHHALEQTRNAYYERYGFADVFANVRRAPDALLPAIERIPGVAAVESRIAQLALLDIPDFREPATGQFISLPDEREQMLNRVFLREGRMPEPGSEQEVLVGENFAAAHGFGPGSRFAAILNGRKRELLIVGTALSPEFVFAVGPGDIMPDDRRFGVIWMPERALAAAYGLSSGFSSVSLKLFAGASEPDVIRQLDRILEPYGGRAAYGRRDQTSHAWLDHQLDMLDSMSRILPPIFLLVAAFLVNITLGRLVALEREQVGLLKALGYRNRAIAGHYVKFVLAIAVVGIAMGSVAGTWLGVAVTRILATYFHFPFLLFSHAPWPYLLGAMLSLVAAAIGAVRAVRDIARLPPAVAMQPPAPPRFRHGLPRRLSLDRLISPQTMMMLRNIGRHPLRTGLTLLGIAFATGIVVVALFIRDIMDATADVTFSLADRQDATLAFGERRASAVAFQVAHMPGVIAVEVSREVPIRIRRGAIERRVMLSGKPRAAVLSRIIDDSLKPVQLPEEGVAISGMLARVLGVRPGDTVEIDLLEGANRTVTVPVAAMVEDYFGIRAMMDADALARLMREAPAASSVHVSLDANQLDAFYAKVKAMPVVSALSLQRASLANFREITAVFVRTMGSIYTGLAAVIAFGVVYNNARISLSESARDLASLRVLGFTRSEALRLLLLELALLTLLAQPPGWAIGYALGWIMRTQLAGEIMRVRGVIEPFTYAMASATVIGAALFSAVVVRTRVYALDLVEVLKTRD
ncbi:MAG: ABC transporter permease [Pseudomonadota bacterium]